jgi:hypothetical protein
MVDLKELFEEYDLKLNLHQVKKAKPNAKDKRRKSVTDETPSPTANSNDNIPSNNSNDNKSPNTIFSLNWPVEFLPKTKYSEKNTEKYLEKKEKWQNFNIYTLKSKKFVKILTQIDLDLIKKIKAEDLVSYEGTSNNISLTHILNKNKSLQLLISSKLEKRQIFRMLKHALKFKNYNLLHILIKALQSLRLNMKNIEKVIYFKEFLEQQEDGIFPFEWMLKDCEDSNLNISSEVASLRFCKIIEKLKKMKNLTLDFKVSESNIHKMYLQLWQSAITTQHESIESIENDTNLFLIL